MSVVVRFAPSPTGPLHIGGVRTALYNFLFARKQGGKFLLRIEDTDQTRFVPGAEEYIVEALAWCGITFDGGVHLPGDGVLYRQSDRMKAGIYREYADALVASGNAYFAFDTPEENEGYRKAAEAEGKTFSYGASTRMGLNNSLTLGAAETQARIAAGMPYVIRFKMPDNEDVSFVDLVREEVTFNTAQLDDKVLLKSDGMPTYHLANVVDDRLMAVTHVIRGEEWLQSTPLHVMLYRAFGWPAPQFVHLPLLLKPVGEGKLSKRDGDQLGFPVFPIFWKNAETGETASGFRESGYLPEALINFLALLGWHPGGDEEIMTLERMTELFALERVSKAGAKFAIDKLRNFNQHYLKEKPLAELLPLVRPYAEAAGYQATDEYLGKAIGIMRERVTYVGDFVTTAPYLFADPAEYDEKLKGKWTADARKAIEAAVPALESHADWTHEALHHVFSEAIQPLGIGAGKVMPALRLAISGVPGGPGVWEIAEVIGREATLRRIRKALEVL